MNPDKPGIKTTEFWGKLILQLVLVINSIFGLGIEMSLEQSLTIAGALEAVYAISRGIAKRKATVKSVLPFLLLIGIAGGCLTQQAIDSGLFPSVQAAWPGVRSDIQYGLETVVVPEVRSEAIEQMQILGTALMKPDLPAIGIADWSFLKGIAIRGIEERVKQGEWSQGVADIVLERLYQFDTAIRRLGAR